MLIDYQGVDLSIFTLVSEHLGRVIVSSQVVLDEVDALEIDDCETLGITCIDPTMEHLALAQASDSALSFHDLLCFALARDEDATCVTNDMRLRNECGDHDIELRWGLQIMLELVEAKALEEERAVEIATAICRRNQTLGEEILERFCKIVARP